MPDHETMEKLLINIDQDMRTIPMMQNMASVITEEEVVRQQEKLLRG